jgi:23S rRNA pseudouridine955/2504/2580 synthase
VVQYITITDEHNGRRIDNFLFSQLKGVPKSMIYRIVRKGEVRINKKRVKPDYKLKAGDELRLPPIRTAEKLPPATPSDQLAEKLEKAILCEDDNLLIINKPAGFAVHGGSGLHLGLIEAMRLIRPDARFLELAHRLDRDTSGCLIIAKKRSVLRELHELLREGEIKKIYISLTMGHWPKPKNIITLSLTKNVLQSGERIVKHDDFGKTAKTIFNIKKPLENADLVEVELHTGRTHQIRVHAQASGHPVAGDEKYGDKVFNQFMKQKGLKRLFLHAASLDFTLPSLKKHYHCEAELAEELMRVFS